MSDLLAIRTNVRRNLGEITPNFYTNPELNQNIGEAYRHYSLRMIDEGEGYFETTAFLGFTAQVDAVALGALTPAFFSVSQLYRVLSNGSLNPLRQDDMRFTVNSTILSGNGDMYLPRWKLRGLNLILQPYPQSTEAAYSGSPPATSGLKLDYNYIPAFPTGDSADDFTFDANFPVIFEPLIELYATIAALEAKDGMGGVSDIQSFRVRLAALEETFDASLQRSEYPDRVQYMGTDFRNYNNSY